MSFARVRLPVLPTRMLTPSAEAAKIIATMICKRTGRYSRSIGGTSETQEGYQPLAYLTPAKWPFGGAIALANAEGKPLYFLPFFLTAPRATRFCNFS